MVESKNNIQIPKENLTFRFSRSAGPGGQNVNKVNTRVTVLLDVPGCSSFTESQKKLILSRLATRTNKTGQIRVTSQRHRTQKQNRIAAIERLQQLVAEALRKKLVRKKTKIPYSARMRRLEVKKQRSQIKKQRAKKNFTGDLED